MPKNTRALTNQCAMRVVAQLRRGSCRFNQLERDTLASSSFALSGVLRKLQRDGMVTRTVVKIDPPAHTVYTLTPLGRSLADSVSPLIKWLDANAPYVDVARRHAREIAAV